MNVIAETFRQPMKQMIGTGLLKVQKPFKGRVSQYVFFFIGLVGHNIWWELVETARSDLKTV